MNQDNAHFSEDHSVWQRLRAGERSAFESTVATHYASIYRQLFQLTGNADTASDLTQETFIEAWKSIRSFAGRAAIRTWLHTIATRVWWRKQRKHPQLPTELLSDNLPATARSPLEVTLAGIDREAVSCALQRLAPLYRAVVVLSYMEEMSHAEIANALGIPIGTVKSRQHEAMSRLRRMLPTFEENPIVEI